MTRTLLINPQLPFNAHKSDSWIRLGLAHLASALKQERHSVSLIDFRTIHGWSEFSRMVDKISPEIAFITSFTSEVESANKAALLIKQNHPEIKTVVGGIHTSIAPQDFKNFDYIVRGEGEITVPKIAGGESIPSVSWGETPDLNTIPFADRTIWSDYRTRIQNPPIWFTEKPWIEFLNARGCPYHCRFCSGPGEQNHFTKELGGKRVPYVRTRSVERVIEELLLLDSEYHFKSIHFHDDQFILNPTWTWKFLDALKESGLDNKYWWVGSRADVILRNKSLVLEMSKRGLDIMSVGFESFSDNLLQFWNKGTTAEMNFEAARFLKNNNIRIFSNTIMGAPRADGKWHIEDDLKNLEALKEIKPDTVSWSIFTPVPGSDLYQWCVDSDLIVPSNSGSRLANENKIKGISYRKIRVMMDEIPNTKRRWFRTLHDRIMIAVEGT